MSATKEGSSTHLRLEGHVPEREPDVEDRKIHEVNMLCEGDMAVELGPATAEKVPGEREVNVDEVGIIGGVKEVPPTAVDQIPEEIWLDIFQTLGNSDTLSCSRTSPEWKAWLSHKRTSFLFLEVAPLLLEELPLEDLLKCRNVCSAWKRGLDDAYQNHPQNLCIQPDDDATLGQRGRIPEVVTTFANAERIQEFLSDMESHPDNPFPGRSIQLECIQPPQEFHMDFNYGQLYKRSLRQLMDSFGHHLYFADFDLNYRHFESIGLNKEELFRECLLSLPNLKGLRVRYVGFGGGWSYCPDKSLPRLPHLESLALTGLGGYYDSTSEILDSCCVAQSIKRLLIHDVERNLSLSRHVYNFPNRELLDIKLTVEDLEGFGNLEQLPSLRKVSFNVCNCSSYEEVDFQRIFKAIEIFSSSVEDVKVVGSGTGFQDVFSLRVDPSSKYRVKLPKLKKLRLKEYDGPLEPLFMLSSLSHLEIEFDDLLRGQRYLMYNVERRLYGTNIWNMLPCLKTLVISRMYRNGRYLKKTYDRKSFEYEMYAWKSDGNAKARRQNVK